MQCVESLRSERKLLPKLRVVVVDGGSSDGSAAELARGLSRDRFRDWVSFLPLEINGGYGWANNQAILTLAQEEVPPEFVHVLNPDTEVSKGAVAMLVRELEMEPRCGAVGSQLFTPDGHRSASAFRFPSAGREFINAARSERLGRLLGIGSTVVESAESADVEWVTGASVMFRVEALRETGLFDDGFFLYFEEVELMHRMRTAGWTIRHVPESKVIHAEGASTGLGAESPRALPAYWYQSRQRYFSLTGGRFAELCANLAWLAGRAVAMAKAATGMRPTQPNQRAADMFGVGSSRISNGRRSIPKWGDAPGNPPAWMART